MLRARGSRVNVLWQFEIWDLLEKAVFFRRGFEGISFRSPGHEKCDISWYNIGEDHKTAERQQPQENVVCAV